MKIIQKAIDSILVIHNDTSPVQCRKIKVSFKVGIPFVVEAKVEANMEIREIPKEDKK